VPPIFQPEVAAKAIVFAATHGRRELLVGWPTVKTVWGNKLAPWLGDVYLARAGFDAQQTDEPVDPDRPDNLDASAPGDWAARGTFDAQARESSALLWITLNRERLAFAAGAALVAVGLRRN
jgi:hypothetical protein